MKKIVVIAALVFGVNLAMAGAGGGKVNNPVYDDTGTVVGTVIEVDQACEVVTVPTHSGKKVFFICPDTDY